MSSCRKGKWENNISGSWKVKHCISSTWTSSCFIKTFYFLVLTEKCRAGAKSFRHEPVTACVELDVCRPTPSVITVMLYRVPGCRPLSSANLTVLFTVIFWSRTQSGSVSSRILNCWLLPGPACQQTLRLCEDKGFTWRSRTEEGAEEGERPHTLHFGSQ